jgi:hypothetical protein
MKTSVASLAGLLGCMAFSSISQAAQGNRPKTSTNTLSLGCQEAVTAARNKSASPSRIIFTPGPSVTVRDNYVIKVFSFKDDSQEHRVVGVIEKGPETDVETARITAICRDETLQPPHSANPGDIEFNGSLGDKVHIRFRLNKKVGDPGHLERHSWKRVGNDSVWMAGPFLPGAVQNYPNKKDWPTCLKPKRVKANGDNLSFDFDSCLTSGKVDLTYIYVLHLDRKKDDGTLEDVVIDPQIINHPH